MSIDALEELRRPLACTEQLHFNNAGVAPMAARAEAAGANVFATMRLGSLGVGQLLKQYEAARTTFARLVNAAPSDLAFFQTCSAAISQVALGLPLEEGDEIVLLDQEYPSNAYPWHRAAERAGARVVQVASSATFDVDQARVHQAIGPRTRVVAVSSVQYSTGATLDLAQLSRVAHGVGAWLVVDAIQSLGVLPFDLAALGVDAVCGGTQKWLLGPLGHGFLGLAPGRRDALAPLAHGAMTYGTTDDAVDPSRPPRSDPRRFEPGTPLVLGAVSAAASVELLFEIGIERVRGEALGVADFVIESARRRDLIVRTSSGADRSPIVTILPKAKSAQAMVEGLRARSCSTAARGGGVRISPHAHNNAAQVDALFAHWDALDR